MLKTGAEHLESIRDGRVIYIGKEEVRDVTTHPAFRNAAQTVAALYDMKADPANREVMTYEEDGDRHSLYFMRPRTREDLARRSRCHRAIADMTYGHFGRSPDHVASFVAGLAMKPDVVAQGGQERADNLMATYRRLRDQDLYAVYAVLPPQAARNPEFYQQRNLPIPTLRVVREEDDGVVIAGMKMLATGAAFANEIWIGNVLPLAPSQSQEAITCSIPVNTPGLSLWSRLPMESKVERAMDYPLSARFDESDCMIFCDDVKVPWEKVIVHGDALLSRNIYIQTPSHCLGNHQSNVRYWSKMRFLLGLASRITKLTGAAEIPAVKEEMGRLSSMEGAIGAMVHGQIDAYESWPEPYVTFNRRMMYAALNWCTEQYSGIVDTIRELTGGGVFQMPADSSVMEHEGLRARFEQYWQTPQSDALNRMRILKLAWDVFGSELAGRHQSYEKFYAGASFIVRNHAYRETPWGDFEAIVDELLASTPQPDYGQPAVKAAE